MKAAALGTYELKAAVLRKGKMQNIKAAALKTTGMEAAALEYVNLNRRKLRPRRSLVKASTLVREKSCLDSKLSNRHKQRLSLYKGLQRTNLGSFFFIFSSIFWERVGFLGGGLREALLKKISREEGASLREEFFLFCFL